MMLRRFFLSLSLATIVAAAPIASVCADAPPSQAVVTVRNFYDHLSATMKQGPSLGFAGRRDRLENAVKHAFDLQRMTRLAVGPRWNALSPEEQAELVNAFGDFSAATYASRFTHDAGEQFEVSPEVTETGDGAIVHTKMIRSNDTPVQLDYFMKQSDSGWKIEDVYLSGTISELATRRSEFTSVLNRGGPQALVDTLRKKAATESGPS